MFNVESILMEGVVKSQTRLLLWASSLSDSHADGMS